MTAENISENKLEDVKGTRVDRIEVKMEGAEKYFESKIEREEERIESFEKKRKH